MKQEDKELHILKLCKGKTIAEAILALSIEEKQAEKLTRCHNMLDILIAKNICYELSKG